MKRLTDNAEFLDKWKFYTEYLIEDHGIVLEQKDTESRIQQLETYSKGNVKHAIQIIDLMICRGETCIFEPSSDLH